MRTDVKVGLICLFLLALALVCFFTLRNNKTKQDIVTSSLPVSPIPAVTPAMEPSSVAAAPATPAITPTTAPSIASETSAAPMLAAPADMPNTGGILIAPPGAATAPSLSTPTTPTNSPGLNTSLVPPASPRNTPNTPTLTSPLNTGSTSNSLLPATSSPSPLTNAPGNTIDLDHPSHRNTLDLSTPSTPHTQSTPTMDLPSDTGLSSGGSAGGAYTIQKGDTLAAVAKKNHVTLKALQAANPGVNPSRLKIGQKINLPGASAAGSSSPSLSDNTPSPTLELGNTAPAPTSRPASHRNAKKSRKSTGATTTPSKHRIPAGGTYTVKKGDTLRKIAKALYGDESLWRRIFRANRGEISSPNDIHPGDVLHLPK